VSLVVQKYGGTSVADPGRIKAVADHIVETRQTGHDVVVVVSAMGRTTDELERLAHEVSAAPAEREMDMLLTAGERISIALLCMAIIDRGEHAVSFTGSQAGIVTDTSHGRAKILDVKADRISDAVRDGAVAVVAGFQGVSTASDVTTLGRGGSDTTAVALAAALGADACEIFTDVAGVFTADPRIVPNARLLPYVSYDEMLDMAATGSKVLAMRCVEMARTYGVPLHVRSSFTWGAGTEVDDEESIVEKAIVTGVDVSGITHDSSEAKVTIAHVPDRPGIAASVFRPLADAGVNVDMIVQNVSSEGHTDISFTLPRDDLKRALQVIEDLVLTVGASGFNCDEGIARVSLVGAGMKTHPGVAATMFETLAEASVNIEMISTSSIRISCVVAEDDVERAVRALHDAFELGKQP
jgi:aspartate kinase